MPLLVELLVSRRRLVISLLAIATIVAGVFAWQLKFDFTPQAIFASDDDVLAFSEEFKQRFGYEDTLLIVLLEATGEPDILDRRALTWQAATSKRLQQLPHVTAVESLATLRTAKRYIWSRPRIRIEPMVIELPVDEPTEARVREVVERSPLVEGALVSYDRRLAATIVNFDPSARDLDTTRSILASVEGVFDEMPPPAGYQLRYSGLPAIRVGIVDDLRDNQLMFVPLAACVFVVVLWFLFRSWAGTVLPLVAVGVGMVWTIGLLAALDEPLNIVTNVLPLLLLIIGVSNCVHVVSRFAEDVGHCGGDRERAIRRTIPHMAHACLLTTATTAIGFASLMAASGDILRDFGWQAALGMGFLYVSTIGVLGTLLPLLPAPTSAGSLGLQSPMARWTARTGRAVALHPWKALGFCLAFTGVCLLLSLRVGVNSYTIETYDEDHPTVETQRLVEGQMAGFIPLEVSLSADREGRFLDPDVYQQVAAAAKFASEQPSVIFVRSYVDLHQDAYAGLRGGRAEVRAELPDLNAKGERRIQWTERMLSESPHAAAYQAFITPDGRHARLLVRVSDVGTRRTLALTKVLENKLAELFPPGSGIEFRLTGDAYVASHSLDGFVRELFYSLLGASVIMFAIIAVLFRSLRMGLVSVLPNITPLVVTLGYMGLVGYDLNVANIIVFAISLGVAVDDTIHFLARYLEESRATEDTVLAIERSFEGTGRAIIITTLLIVGGLSVLLLSDFVPTRRFAELTSVTMAAALLGDLLLLPACLVLFSPSPVEHRRQPRREMAEVSARDF